MTIITSDAARQTDFPGWHMTLGEPVVDGRVVCAHRKVAIVGAGPGRMGAPFGDPSWCVWALNEIPQPTFHRHFELHPMAVQSMADLDVLSTMPAPCYVIGLEDATGPQARPVTILTSEGHKAWAKTYERPVRNPVQFPLNEIVQAHRARHFFTCTFAYQIALAIHEGFEVIGLWGMALQYGSPRERLVEKGCLDYWIGRAEGAGIVVEDDTCELAYHPRLYGFEYWEESEYAEDMVEGFRKTSDAWYAKHAPVRRPVN